MGTQLCFDAATIFVFASERVAIRAKLKNSIAPHVRCGREHAREG